MKNILLTGSNGFVGSYFIDNYNKKYNIKTFSFLNDNFEGLNLSNTDTITSLQSLHTKVIVIFLNQLFNREFMCLASYILLLPHFLHFVVFNI